MWKFAERFCRYLSVGVICALLFNVVMIGGAILDVGYVTSFIISFFVVTSLAYALHARHTFRTQSSWLDFARFAATQLVGAGISFALLAFFCSGLGMSAKVASPLCTLCLLFWNFLATHWALGSPRGPSLTDVAR